MALFDRMGEIPLTFREMSFLIARILFCTGVSSSQANLLSLTLTAEFKFYLRRLSLSTMCVNWLPNELVVTAIATYSLCKLLKESVLISPIFTPETRSDRLSG